MHRDDPGRDAVRQRLRDAAAADTRLELRALQTMQSAPPLLTLAIATVREDDFIVSPPAAEVARQLRHGMTYSLGFFDPEGRLAGETTCLGRTQLQDDRQRVQYTYRFSLPKSLHRLEQKTPKIRGPHIDADIEAELQTMQHRSPIFGTLVDLGRRSVKIRCHNAMNKMSVGQHVILKVQLPAPVGLITEKVRISGLQPGDGNLSVMVAVAFLERIQRLEDLFDDDGAASRSRRAG